METRENRDTAMARAPDFVDPVTHAPLRRGDDEVTLVEPLSGAVYRIENNIADLVHPRPQDDDPRTPRFDRPLPAVVEAFLTWTFGAFGGDEAELRGRIIDKLDLAPDAIVLDNACGTGASTRHLQARLPHGVLCNTDLSMELLAYGASQMAAEAEGVTCRTIWCGANALHLPFADNSFDAVLSIGGFNQFGDAAKAVAEMTRVTRTGGRIVIADEGYAPWLRQTLLGRMVINDNPLMAFEPPVAALPEVAQDVRLEWMLGNAFYCLDFRVGDAPPQIDIDRPHEGLRGGTIRSRYEAARQRRGEAMNGEDTGRGKVFCIGFPKTGTTSLEVALQRLGYNVCRGSSRNNHSNFLMALQVHGDTDEIARVIRHFDAFTDLPFGGTDLYLWLSRRYPEARFLHTFRAPEPWYRSILNQLEKAGGVHGASLEALHASGGYGASMTVQRVWGITDPVARKDAMLRYYQDLNAAILAHFDGCENFLSIDLTQEPDWRLLCGFLGLPVPDQPFPHENPGQGKAPGRASDAA